MVVLMPKGRKGGVFKVQSMNQDAKGQPVGAMWSPMAGAVVQVVLEAACALVVPVAAGAH